MTDVQNVSDTEYTTGYEAGLGGFDEMKIALEVMASKPDGIVSVAELYAAVEDVMRRYTHNGRIHLNEQGKASIRYVVNRIATRENYIHALSEGIWQITDSSREYTHIFRPIWRKS